MTEPIVTREQIAERARQAAAQYLKTGRTPMNEFPALSGAAQLFGVVFRRCVSGGEPEESEASA